MIDGGAVFDKIYNHGDKVTVDAGAASDTIRNYGAARVSINGGEGNDTIYNGVWNYKTQIYEGFDSVTIDGGNGNDSLYGGVGADKFVYASGDGKDYIIGFENTNMLKITGAFSTSYNGSKKEIYFDVGSTANAMTIKNFSATTFNINGTNYKISGAKLVKK